MPNKSRWCLLSEKTERTPCPFGEVVLAARIEQGVSRYRLAKLIGRTPQQLAKLEKGENVIAHALEIDPCILFRKTVELMPSIPVIEEPEGSREQP